MAKSKTKKPSAPIMPRGTATKKRKPLKKAQARTRAKLAAYAVNQKGK